jgi:hypothetical protein
MITNTPTAAPQFKDKALVAGITLPVRKDEKEAQNGYFFGATPKRIVISDSASITARVNEARRFFK